MADREYQQEPSRNLPGQQPAPPPPAPKKEDNLDLASSIDIDNQAAINGLAADEGINPSNQVQEFYEERLGLEPSVSSGGRRRPKKPKSKSGSASGSSSSSSSDPEAENLSNILNQLKEKRLEGLSKDEEDYKNTKFGKFNVFGQGRRKAKKIIVGALISAVAAGGVAVAAIIPQAVDQLITGATNSYSNFSSEAIIKNSFNKYLKEDVLVGKCLEATSANPAARNKCNQNTSKKTGLIGRAMEDFKATKMDKKLAERGISFGYDPATEKFTVIRSKDGNPIPDLSKSIDIENLDIFELGKDEGSKFIDSTVRDTINQESRWKKYFIRGPTIRAYRTRIGGTGCLFLCKTKDKVRDGKKIPKKAFGKFIKVHILKSESGVLSNIADCLTGGGAACTSRAAREKMIGQVSDIASKILDPDLVDKMVEEFSSPTGKGPTRLLMEEAVKKISSWISKEVSQKAASNIVGVLLLVKTIGSMVDRLEDGLPKILRIKNMMAIALVASTFLIMINESRSGSMPLGDYGAMLSTFIGMSSSRIFASIFMGPDSSTAKNGQPYSCNNAEEGGVVGTVSSVFAPSKISGDNLTCDSFKLDYTPSFLDNPFLTSIDGAWDTMTSACVPGVCMSDIVDAIDKIESLFGDALSAVISKFPGYDSLMALIAEKSTEAMQGIFTAISPSIVTDDFAGTIAKAGAGPGARVFDSLAGGICAINCYLTARDEMGGGVLDTGEMAELDSAIAEQRNQDVQYASLYDRFFNLDSTEGVGTSLLTEFASSLPGNYNVASLVNPMQNLSLAAGNVGGSSAFATSGSITRTIAEAFAIPVRGHNASVINKIAKGEEELPEPESEECKSEIETFKSEIESNSDSSDEDKQDALGYGLPEMGSSLCLAADTSLKVVTTDNTETNDFEIASIAGGAAGAANVTLDGVECPAAPLETQQVGSTTYYKMPEDPAYSIYSREAARFGSKELVCALYSVGRAYNTAMGGASKLNIGDLNASGHASHHSGVAVDIQTTGSVTAADITNSKYDVQATITLGKLFVDTGIIQSIWFCENGTVAKPRGVAIGPENLSGTDGAMDAIRDYATSKGTPITMYCISGHKDHFHVNVLDQFKGADRSEP